MDEQKTNAAAREILNAYEAAVRRLYGPTDWHGSEEAMVEALGDPRVREALLAWGREHGDDGRWEREQEASRGPLDEHGPVARPPEIAEILAAAHALRRPTDTKDKKRPQPFGYDQLVRELAIARTEGEGEGSIGMYNAARIVEGVLVLAVERVRRELLGDEAPPAEKDDPKRVS